MTAVLDLIKSIMERLKDRHPDDHIAQQQDAWWLLEALTDTTEADLIAQKEIELTHQQKEQLDTWLHEHVANHKPLQYILGFVPFCNLEIIVKPPILIPRPETEEWAFNFGQQLQELEHKDIAIFDIGCGTGCIALYLATISPLFTVYATDISEEAIELSKRNAVHNQIANVGFVISDLFAQLPVKQFDVIVSNPPYIPEREWNNLDTSVTQWEDHKALIAGDDGLDIIKKIIEKAPRYLKKNEEMSQKQIPQLVLEIDYTQGAAVSDLLKQAGFINIHILKDLEGKDRVAIAGL